MGTALGLYFLFPVLGLFGIASFGPCGPDLPGFILFGAMALSAVTGVPLTIAGAVVLVIEHFKNRRAEDVEV